MGKHKTAEQQAFLRDTIPNHTYAETAELYNERFGIAVTVDQLSNWAHDNGVRRNLDHMEWTTDKVEFMRRVIPGHSVDEIGKLFAEHYGITLRESQIKNFKVRFGIKSRTVGGRFPNAHVPGNKGKTWDEYMSKEGQARARATQFKKDHLPYNAREIGEERVSKEGYIEVHVSQHRKSKANDQWRPKHHIVWEEANGKPVPPHTMIVFADRDKRNFDPDNLVAVPRSLWSVISRQQIAYHDRESLEIAMDIAKLHHGAYSAMKRPRECKRCGSVFEPRYPQQATCDECLQARR